MLLLTCSRPSPSFLLFSSFFPSHSQYNYTQIYTSEYFDDNVNACPSLLTNIKTYDGLDSKMRLSIFYSSNLTGGKEVLLGSATFTERELARGMNIAGELVTDIMSEHLVAPTGGAKCYVEVVPPFPVMLDASCIPITAAKYERNPLKQDYVFYMPDTDVPHCLYPELDAREETWEPKFSAHVPVVFLKNFHDSLTRSVKAWEERYDLERMRQSRFVSTAEAHSHGWHVIDIQVKGARMFNKSNPNAHTHLSMELTAAALSQAIGPNSGAGGNAGGGPAPGMSQRSSSVASLGGGLPGAPLSSPNVTNAPANSGSNAAPPPVPGSAQLPFFVLNFPLTSDHVEDYGGVNATASNGMITLQHQQSFSSLERQSRRSAAGGSNVGVAGGGGGTGGAAGAAVPRKTIFGGNSVIKKVDESAPNTFVEVHIEDG